MARHEESAQHVIRAVQELELAESERTDLLQTALRLARPGSLVASVEETQRLAVRLADILFPRRRYVKRYTPIGRGRPRLARFLGSRVRRSACSTRCSGS